MDIDDDDFNWSDFFRTQFKEIVTSDAIARFKEEYQGSDEEKAAVLEAYEAGEGDMDNIYEEVMLSNPLEDDDRFRAIIDDAIKMGTVEGFTKYTKESKKSKANRVKKAQGEAEEAREMAREMGVETELFGNGTVEVESSKKGKKKSKKVEAGSEDALAAIIQKRQQSREEDFFSNLEAKYAPKGKKSKRTMEEPPEEAFQRTAERKSKSKKA